MYSYVIIGLIKGGVFCVLGNFSLDFIGILVEISGIEIMIFVILIKKLNGFWIMNYVWNEGFIVDLDMNVIGFYVMLGDSVVFVFIINLEINEVFGDVEFFY